MSQSSTMTGDQLALALEQLEVSRGWFAEQTGVDPRRLRRMLTGEAEIPPYMPLVCALLTLPGAKELAEKVTDHLRPPVNLPEVRPASRSPGITVEQVTEALRNIRRHDT